MALSAYLGLLLTSGGQATLVAVAARDLPAGVTLEPGDLELKEAVLAEPSRYLTAEAPTGTLSAPVAKGELVPKRVVAEGPPPLRLVAVPVAVDRLPTGLARGSRVDVWSDGRLPVLQAVPVSAVTDPERWSAGTATVVLAVEGADVPTLLQAVRSSEVDVTAYQEQR